MLASCCLDGLKRMLAWCRTFLSSLLIGPVTVEPCPVTAEPFENGWVASQRRDYATACRVWRPLAQQGHQWAQSYLGAMYAKGQGVPKDDHEAVHWYRLAAEQGNAPAQSNLGDMYATGRGVPKDDHEAVRWYGLAAEQGYAHAQSNLGDM